MKYKEIKAAIILRMFPDKNFREKIMLLSTAALINLFQAAAPLKISPFLLHLIMIKVVAY